MIRPLPRLSCRRALRPGLVLAACCLLSAGTAVAAPAPRVLFQDEGPKPALPAPPRALAPFDCTARDTFTLAAALWDTVLAGDTTGAPAVVGAYGCRAWPEQGPEHIYRLEVAADLQLRAALSDLGAQDLDLFLLDGCDSDQCLAGANSELSLVLPAGTYWLVVDGYGTTTPAAGPYTLTLETRWAGVPPAVCLDGGAVPVTCAGTAIDLEGDLEGATNLLQAYDCSPALVTGGEAWYELTIPGTHEVAVRATPALSAPTLDLVLWVFDGCGDQALCLDDADARAGGDEETVMIENLSAEPLVVLVAVDARRAPDTGGGAFTVTFGCQSNVAAQRRSLGSVKSLFR